MCIRKERGKPKGIWGEKTPANLICMKKERIWGKVTTE